MVCGTIKAQEYLERYGAQLSQQLLTDLLENVTSDEIRREIQKAVEELNVLILTDEKAQFLNKTTHLENTLSSLPPAFDKGWIQAWLFDDAIISFNKVADHFHGYRKEGEKTVRLSSEELRLYRQIIENPAKLLTL